MQTLIKEIRNCLDMSQADLAERLNLAFATVNRWENGRAVPNRLAQTMLYELCKNESVPVYDLILSKIRQTAEGIGLPEGRKLLYHGSKSGISGKIEPISRAQCDFGRGFYMGTDAAQALALICDFDRSLLYAVSVDMSGLGVAEVPVGLEWALLVAYHRGRMETVKGSALYEKCRSLSRGMDLVIGSIADDRIFYALDSFFTGAVTDAALVAALSALNLGKQYVAVTQKGCDAVRIEAGIGLSYLERLFIRDAAEENRAKGVSLAADICKKYRRRGLFFDEILAKAGE